MALTILDYDKKVQNIPTRNISGQNNLGKLTKKTTKHMEFSIFCLTPPLPTYGKSIVIFYCLKMISDSF